MYASWNNDRYITINDDQLKRPLHANLLQQQETKGIHTNKKLKYSKPLCQYHCRALRQCFRSQRLKLENRQFLAKVHQIAPNCVSNFKNLRTDGPPFLERETPTPRTPSPSANSMIPWQFHTAPETNGWCRPLDQICQCISSDSVTHRLLSVCNIIVAFLRVSWKPLNVHCTLIVLSFFLESVFIV